MTSLPLHPAVVHLPMGLAVVIPLVALIVAWRWSKASWGIVVLLQALLFAGAFVALETGEDDEERVEQRLEASGVGEAPLEAHEDAAKVFTGAAAAVLALMVAGFFAGEGRRWLPVLAAVGALAVAGLGLRVGHAGGELVYVHGAAAVAPGAGGAPPTTRRHDDDDDD